ncbi:MAG: dTDP-glucose 4,6-dehydratase [Myxococcota bacterium]
MKKLLITGGAGFIGSNLIYYILKNHPEYEMLNLDALTYAGNLENLKSAEGNPRYKFLKGNIAERKDVEKAIEVLGGIDAILNLAAESHVDRSIVDATPFLDTNIKGTFVLLETALKLGGVRFVQISTDEVYGSLGKDGKFTEETPLAPNSPYSASKASADLLTRAYFRTHRLDAVITRCSNNYGPYQFPEKLLPLMITNLFEGKPLPVYGDGMQVRDWIYVDDHCAGIMLALERGKAGEIYNFGGNAERTNLSLVKRLVKVMGKDENELITFVKDRPGHDRRYAIDYGKAKRELGFEPKHNIDEELENLVKWYRENESWWRRIKSGEYRGYYESLYGKGGMYGGKEK